MADDQSRLGKRARLVRALSFPVCTSAGTAVGYVCGAIAAQGKDAIFPPQISFALLGLLAGVVVSAIVATSIDIFWRHK
jgi:hypothetical protein